jgi:cyanophycin synthetase
VENGQIMASKGAFQHSLPLSDIPVTMGGSIGFQVDNAMAAVAAAWALAVPWDTIRAGLASFANDKDNAQGRFNLFAFRGATVIADYGHNPDAMVALVQAVQAMPATRRSVVISGAGDRRDQDIRQQTEILGDAFDEVILFEDQCQRGRKDGEVIALLRQGLANAQRTTQSSEIRGEFLAIDTALDKLAPGELCLVLVDQVQEALAHIAARVNQG